MKASIGKGASGGIIAAPPSKSYTIRALFAAALAGGESRIHNPLVSEDTEAAAEVLSQLGAEVQRNSDSWTISGGHLKPPVDKMNCRQSAATLRFLAPVCAALRGISRITFAPGLARRPMIPLFKAFSQLGVSYEFTGNCLNIYGSGGRFKADTVSIPGNVSSQFVSGLLFAAPLVEGGLIIRLTTPAESRDYLRMTIDCLRTFGVIFEANETLTEFKVEHQAYKPAEYTIEGDWSSASYFLGLGAISSAVTVTGLNPDSFQADRFVLNCMRRMDAKLTIDRDTITVIPSRLQPLDVDLNEAIDLLPTVACLAAVAEGQSIITGLGRARLKESDRVKSVAENLTRMGISAGEQSDRLVISGGIPHGALIDSFDDHRIAMAFAMLGATCGDTVINSAECVNKTYPGFWDDFKKIGGKVTLSE